MVSFYGPNQFHNYRTRRLKSEGKAAVLEQNALEVPKVPVVDPSQAMPPPMPPSVEADKLEIEDLYVRYRKLLLFVGSNKFRIPECDSESLIQEVFLSYIQVGTPITNKRSWLVAAMCNASRHYWRAQGRTESLPDDFAERSDPRSQELADSFALKMTISRALGYLQPRCRETLQLHYFQGHSAGDVARELETTNRYAEKLIHNCLKRVREIYKSITAVKR